MLKPDSGRIFFDGYDILTLGDFRRARFRNREIGFVFQFFNLLPDITSRQNIMYPAILNPHAGNIDQLVDYLVDYLHLNTIINQYPATLSGGERQRVAVARALINNPKVVMADEPTGNLDEDAAKGIVSLFRNIKETKGITTIIATHDSRVVAGAGIHFHLDDQGCHLVRNSLTDGRKYSASKKALGTKTPFSDKAEVKKPAVKSAADKIPSKKKSVKKSTR
jgi:lipoprotein-releasing system ATP-binding protein